MRRRKDQAIQARVDEDINKKHIPNQFFSPLNKIFALCLVLRIINSLLVQTYFNPDEHWQSLEVAHTIAFGGLVLCLTTLLMYGSWVIVPLNFLKFDFLSSGGDYYGTHPWHCGSFGGLVAWVLGTYSLLGHKEFRFVLPVLPLALMFTGYSLAKLGLSELSKRKLKESPSSHVKCLTRLQMVVFFLLLTNIPMALYMSMVHQRGTEDVMNYLSKEASENNVENILFLIPCHAATYYSTLHHDLPMRYLDCTRSEEGGILDESD